MEAIFGITFYQPINQLQVVADNLKIAIGVLRFKCFLRRGFAANNRFFILLRVPKRKSFCKQGTC